MDQSEQKVIDDVKKYGWHVLQIVKTEDSPAVAFSVGLCKTFKHPEIIIFGMDLDLMHQLINNMVLKIKEGEVYAVDKEYPEILEGYNCKFLPVDKKWYSAFMGWALWFYKGDEFTTLQCVWPDKENNWSWEKKFNKKWKGLQPLLVDEDYKIK